METRTNGLTFTHAGDVRAARVNYAGAYRTADRRGQRGSKRVTPYMVTLADGRERRAHVVDTAAGPLLFVTVKGVDVLLDDQTQDALARMHAHGTPFQPVRPHAELVEATKADILEDVRARIVPANVPGFNELHDYADANMYGWREEDEDTSYISSPVIGPVQEEVHQWILAGGIVAAVGEVTPVTDAAEIDRLSTGYDPDDSIGDDADGDDFTASYGAMDGQAYGEITTSLGQTMFYRCSDLSAAHLWLAVQAANLSAPASAAWPV